jgi:anti-sigma B factor antagonist
VSGTAPGRSSPAGPGAGPRMEVTSRPDGITVVKPLEPRLDVESAPVLRATLREIVQSGSQRLVIDLAEVSYVDSSGLGALISALKMVRTRRDRRDAPRPLPSRRPAKRGDLKLANVGPLVLALLQIIRLDRVFEPYPGVDAATSSFTLDGTP